LCAGEDEDSQVRVLEYRESKPPSKPVTESYNPEAVNIQSSTGAPAEKRIAKISLEGCTKYDFGLLNIPLLNGYLSDMHGVLSRVLKIWREGQMNIMGVNVCGVDFAPVMQQVGTQSIGMLSTMISDILAFGPSLPFLDSGEGVGTGQTRQHF
jgi:hypothetical protein